MPTVFKHSLVSQIGTSPIDVVEVPPGVRATVIGCNLSNTTEFDQVVVDIQVVGADTTAVYYAKGLTISPGSSVKVITGGEKLILPADTELRIVSDTVDSVDATVSYVEIS